MLQAVVEGWDDEEHKPSEQFVGVPKAGTGKWASCIRITDCQAGETLFIQELEEDEAAFSAEIVTFDRRVEEHKEAGLIELVPGAEQFLVVGTAKDLQLAPRKLSSGYLHVYRFVDYGRALELLHRTAVPDVPLALAEFQDGKLLVGCGPALRVYELGKKKLLRKSENKAFPTTICSLHVQGDRVFVGDLCESMMLVTYQKLERQLLIMADVVSPRYLTTSVMLDYDTIAGGDKFGNAFVVRLPKSISERIDRDPAGGQVVGHSQRSTTLMARAPYKMQEMVHFHVGDMITSMIKTALVPGGTEVLLFSTITGALGVLLPFTVREDVELLSHLEMHMRQELPPLLGRDHMAYRSYYFPVKDCVDGDLTEMFTSGQLDYDRQRAVAEELVSTPTEVAKKLEELRNRVL